MNEEEEEYHPKPTLFFRPKLKEKKEMTSSKSTKLDNVNPPVDEYESALIENQQLKQILSALESEQSQNIAKLEQELKEKQARNEKQKAQFDHQIKLLNEKIALQENKIKELQQASLLSDDSQEEINIDTNIQLSQLQQQKLDEEKNISELGSLLIDSQQRLKDIREKVKSLPQHKSIENVQIFKTQLEREAKNKINHYQIQITALETTEKELNAKLLSLIEESEKLQKENVSLFMRSQQLEKSVNVARKDCFKMKKQIEENGLMVDLEFVKTKIKNAEQQKQSEINKVRKMLQNKLEEVKKQNEDLQNELNERCLVIEELNNKVSELTQQAIDAKEFSKGEIRKLMLKHKKEIKVLTQKFQN
ncbi:hypothetical protein GPJ56_006004 [Histomonas meleagridis]|uniref:uncharacterized protein n=1 Tax=Histomonas meleagridis TaxID=135588 RepID=UPI003559AD02|nr:hypothetical protein GPJ56_006004 [Histomonas meleagridis]KAH0799411.1 hypothetical protein GO595_007812 [Histomonas meleagridis]